MKRIGGFILLLLALAIGIYALAREHPETQQASHVAVRLKWLHQAQFAGFYSAQQLGLYRREHLDVELLPGGVDQPAIFQVLSGAVQFGVTGADQVLLARQEGHPIVAVAVIYRQTPFALFSKQSLPITTLVGFRGKRVGVKYGGNEEVTYRAMLHAIGLDSTAVQEVGVKYDMTPFFVDQVSLWPGYRINESLAAEEHGVPIRIFRPEDVGVNMYADVVITSESFARTHPELVRSFLAATMQGWQFAIQHPEQAGQYTSLYNPDANVKHEISMMRASIPLITSGGGELGRMDSVGWEQTARVLKQSGRLPESFSVGPAFSNEWLRPRGRM